MKIIALEMVQATPEQIDGHYPKDHDYPAVPREAVLGDCWHRFYVRMLEVIQSIDLIRQGFDRYSTAEGDYGEPVKLNQKLPKGEVYLVGSTSSKDFPVTGGAFQKRLSGGGDAFVVKLMPGK